MCHHNFRCQLATASILAHELQIFFLNQCIKQRSCALLQQCTVRALYSYIHIKRTNDLFVDSFLNRSTSVRELQPTSSSTRLLTPTSSSVSQTSHVSDSTHMERHGKEAGLTQGAHGGPHHLLTPSGIAAELRLVFLKLCLFSPCSRLSFPFCSGHFIRGSRRG